MNKTVLIMVLLLSSLSCQRQTNTAEGRTYRIGYMICNSKEETLRRFKPLTAYLSRKLGVSFEMSAIDTVDFTKEVDNLDFTHTNSLLYVIMNRNHGVEVLAAEKSGPLGARAKGLIIALRKSGIRNVRDLRGRSMVFGPMLGPTSYMAQLDILLKNGIDPERDLSLYSIPPGSYKHEKVIYGVLMGKYDAGAAPLLDFERMNNEGRIDKDDFTILAEGEPIPYCTFGATQNVDDALARQFRQALLGITKDDAVDVDGEIVKVLGRAQIDGYEDVRNADFDPVRNMAKRTNMPPFQKY